EHAEKQIKEAIRDSEKLRSKDIIVFTQGSYRNRVNVKKDSDVDVGVLCYDTFFPDYPDDNVKSKLEKSFSSSNYTYKLFKNDVENALITRFGRESVKRSNKAFDIKSNSYRVEADVASFFEHRRYNNENSYLSGVQMIPDNNRPPRVRNWPEQHYQNGVNKNNLTGRRYKKTVRILKTLSNEMLDNGVPSAFEISGFLIECLVWNALNNCFDYPTFKKIIRAVLAYLFNNTMNDNNCKEWGEVSELKYLFRSSQPWTRQQAHEFISSAWDYIGFE